MSRKHRAAIAFKAHTGWAVAVIAAETRSCVEIIAKARIGMIDGFEAAAVYHRGHAGSLSVEEAGPMIEAAARAAIARAKKEIAALVAATADRGLLTFAAILSGSSRPLPALEAILRSHPLVHAAEGELYRDVLVRACEALGLRTMRVPSKDLAGRAAAALGLEERAVLARLAKAGAASGRPWAADQRECALAAWTALGRDVSLRD